jgi:acetyl esterase
MPVDPTIQVMLDAANAQEPMDMSTLSVVQQRAIADQAMQQYFVITVEPGPELPDVHDVQIPVDGGEIALRIYTPERSSDAPLPGLVYFHGGAWWLGDLDQTDAHCRFWARDAGCVVVSVDYRLAPEHKFPIPAEDCYAATVWAAEHVDELGVDPARIAVGGGSAGGNLAAAVTLMARDRGGPPIVFQILDIPVTDATMSQPSITENAEGYILTKAAMEQGWRHYLADPADGANPYASPLAATDLSGLPPALVSTAEYDPLRDEGEEYGRRLEAAGVPVTIRRWDGMVHGFEAFTKILPQARECRDWFSAALRDAFASEGATR